MMEIYRLIFSPIEENTYILAQAGECAIIDCGCYDRQEFSKLERFLSEKELKPVLLLNTHCHLDHVFGNGFILEKYNLRTLSSELEENNRVEAPLHAELFGLHMERPPEPAAYLNDNQVLMFGQTEIVCLHVPGHTAGSIAFRIQKLNCVFTGDALFNGSIGRTDLPGGDFETLIGSIKTKLFSLPEDTIVYPGHGESTTIGDEINYNPFFS